MFETQIVIMKFCYFTLNQLIYNFNKYISGLYQFAISYFISKLATE